MEISDFSSKVEEAYKVGKNKPGFNEAVKYIQDVVREAENLERESAKAKEQTKGKKVIRADEDYEK